MPTYALSTDSFQSFERPADAQHHAMATVVAKQVWAILNFDGIALYTVFFSESLAGGGTRHAEENVLLNFATVLGRSTILKGTLLQTCHLLISDSPCTINDRRPSDAIAGPPSCFSKLCRHAGTFDALTFDVRYKNHFGVMDQYTSEPHMGEALYNVLKRTRLFGSRLVGGGLPPHELALVRSVVGDLFPGHPISEELALRIAGELNHIAQSTGFSRAHQSGNVKELRKAIARCVTEAVARTIGATGTRPTDVASSIYARSLTRPDNLSVQASP